MGVGAYSGLQSISEAELRLDKGLLPPRLGPFTAPLFSISPSERNPQREVGSVRTHGIKPAPQWHDYLTRRLGGNGPRLDLVVEPHL